jgi:hypothetical protein
VQKQTPVPASQALEDEGRFGGHSCDEHSARLAAQNNEVLRAIKLLEDALNAHLREARDWQRKTEEMFTASLDVNLHDTRTWVRLANEHAPLRALNEAIQSGLRVVITLTIASGALLIATHWAAISEVVK